MPASSEGILPLRIILDNVKNWLERLHFLKQVSTKLLFARIFFKSRQKNLASHNNDFLCCCSFSIGSQNVKGTSLDWKAAGPVPVLLKDK